MAESSSPPPIQPSRYRSQRQKHASLEEQQQQQHGAVEDSGVVRSQSRYRRKQGGTAASPPDTRPASQDTPARYHSKHRSPPLKQLYQEQFVQAPRINSPTSISSETYHTEVPHTATPPAGLGAQDISRNISSGSDERYDSDADRRQQSRDRPSRTRSNEKPQTPTLPVYHPPAVTGELFPRPMEVAEPVRHDGPPQSGQIRATHSLTDLNEHAGEETGCFAGLFKRKKGDAATGMVDKSMIARPATAKHTEPIRPGGGGVVPGIDAPKSAVNAGDRQVLVECHKSQRWFPVKPETTSMDIIEAAATVMSERIDIKSALLVETFNSVGVQRPLRRYEQIRDVLNSWDDDAQNTLTLVDPGAGTIEPELTMSGAPQERPEGETWLLTSSYRPGKWEKRYVTLKPDGQMVQQKDMDKPKDVSNVCHLSDFDIYTPTTERKKGKIKPPKKYCFAIKSQQKTTMFESTEDYVHFFCTADPATSDSFYKAVQSYRSWYLVNVRGRGRTEKSKPAPAPAPPLPALQSQKSGDVKDRHMKERIDSANTHRLQESTESHYQLGSFKPLVDFATFESRPHSSESGSDKNNSGGRARPADVKRSNPRTNAAVLGEDEPLANLGRSASVSKHRTRDQRHPDNSEFKDTGLLGRTYSQRRKENERDGSRPPNGREDYQGGASDSVQRRTSTRKHNSNEGLQRSGSRNTGSGGYRRREGSVELGRSTSQRRKQAGAVGKPLIDLTPEFREAPQFKSKGGAHRPDRVGAGGLIQAATTPEDPLNIPRNTVFRNQGGGQHHNDGAPGRTPSGGNDSQTRGGFTGDSLLASAAGQRGWGTGDQGRGVIDGSRAGGKPLVDFSGDSQYAKGSLLGKVEQAQGGPVPAPVIDREKRND